MGFDSISGTRFDQEPSQLETELRELRTYKADQEHRLSETAEKERETHYGNAKESITRFCEEQVRSGTMTPVISNKLLAEIDDQSLSFSQSAPLRVSLDWVRSFVAAQPSRFNPEEVGTANLEFSLVEGSENPSQTLARLAGAKMAELNLTYGQAADYILKTKPDLAKAYRDYTIISLGG